MDGSAKAGTTADRHICELWVLAWTSLRAPQTRASGAVRFFLTSTYMEVGDSEIASGNRVTGMLVCVRQVQTASEMSFKGTPNYYTQFLKDGACDLCSV